MLDEVEHTIVGSNQGQVVYLKDIATVEWNYEDLRYFGRYNGKRAVFIIASMKQMQNIHETRDQIYEKFDAFEKTLPQGSGSKEDLTRPEMCRTNCDGCSSILSLPSCWCCITLLPLGFRASGIVMVSIPLSIMIGLTGTLLHRIQHQPAEHCGKRYCPWIAGG